ncbi:MAG: isoprenyl transferase [Bacteroidaceae bacterium]|nr:isoprenyl transferase [Bacteroidaceae bacterium]MCF0187276.1 isoprenyl transferase [Bacteroidaceae bacterium]
MDNYKEQLDVTHIPQHIAIIMDGNGRWAKARGQHRSFGHQAGVATVNEITTAACNLGVKYLTLYTFSTENWNRPVDEVAALMGLIMTELKEELFMKNNVRFRYIGDFERLPHNVQELMHNLEQNTMANDKMTLVIAISYSSRWELTHAAQCIAQKVKEGRMNPEDIDESCICQHLNTSFMPDPELLIRTGGELRLSNYLLWQCAYSELYFCDTFWPDFKEEDLYHAIFDYQQRERRFGKTSEQVCQA